MMLRFVRTESTFTELMYSAYINEVERYRAEIPLNFADVVAKFYHNTQVKYKLCHDGNERLRNMFKLDSSFVSNPFYILNSNDESVGYVFGKQTKSFWGGGYWYYEYDFCGCRYLAYSIGMGKEGIKIPIYVCNQGEQQIALIEKDVAVYDNKDEYRIYAQSESELEIAALFNFYYDFVKFGNRSKLVYKTKKVEYIHSPKILKDKYKPDFKLQCLGRRT